MTFSDPLGLFAIDLSCDKKCSGFPGFTKDVVNACNYTKKPACAEITSKFWFKGKRLNECIDGLCKSDVPLKCEASVKGKCGFAGTAFGGHIYVYGGHDGCPKQQGYGYGPTIFHESMHLCGLQQEPSGYAPYNQGAYSSIFSKIMDICTGYQE
jgi:hypothetical protein